MEVIRIGVSFAALIFFQLSGVNLTVRIPTSIPAVSMSFQQ